jgi:fucose permease
VTVIGVFVHVAVSLGWGLLFARLAGGLRGLRLAGAVLVVTIAALAVDVFVVGRLLGVNVSDVLAPAQVIALHGVLGVTLGVGMRLATSYLRSD